MINIEQDFNFNIKVSYIDKNGDIAFSKFNIPESERYDWEVTKKTDSNMFSWDGKPVRKKATKMLNSYRITEFLESLPEKDQTEIFQYNEPKKYFVDIETDCSEEFWKPSNPMGSIQTISIVSGAKNLAMVLSTKNLSSDRQENIQKRITEYFAKFNTDIKFKFVYFANEYEMLYSFFDQAMSKMTLITGWNFVEFDWNYLIGRAKILGIDAGISSPTGKLHGRNRTPLHRIVVDYLEIYKKWDRKVDVKESGTLDWVAKEVLGIEKIKYPGSLATLYENDFETFVFYNAVDSLLVKFIDDELNTLVPYLQLSYLTRTEAHKAFSPVAMVENLLIIELLKQNKVLLHSDNRTQQLEKSYEGAYVKEPELGFHKLLGTFDFSSLYPTTIRQWNISPEVFLGIDKGLDTIENPDIIKCANGALFKRNEDGILRVLLTNIFKRRKDAQKTAKIAEKEIYLLKEYLAGTI